MRKTLHKICDTVENIYHLLIDWMSKTHPVPHAQPTDDAKSVQHNKLLDIQDVLTILGIGRTTYYRFVKLGKLVPRRIGERHCYYYSDLDEMIRESKRRGRI